MALFPMVTHGTAGDVLPFVRLGRALRARGHDVVLITHAPYAVMAARAGLDFAAIDEADRYRRHLNTTHHLLQARAPRDIASFFERSGLFERIRFELGVLIERYRRGETVFVGRHTTGAASRFAAEIVGAPAAWVALSPVQTTVDSPVALNYQHGLHDGFNRLRATLGLSPLTDWRCWLDSADTVIGLWPEWFDRAGIPAPPSVRLTGFVLGDDTGVAEVPATLESSLAQARRPVLLTGGTGRMLNPKFYRVGVDAVAATGGGGLLVTPYRDLVPDPLPPGVRWYPSLPFPAVMPRMAALLHHGGIGTVVRALQSATPQVIMADGTDRPDNARRLAALGLARWSAAEEWTVDGLATLLCEVVDDAGYRQRVALHTGAGDIGAGVDLAADALEHALSSAAHPAGTPSP